MRSINIETKEKEYTKGTVGCTKEIDNDRKVTTNAREPRRALCILNSPLVSPYHENSGCIMVLFDILTDPLSG